MELGPVQVLVVGFATDRFTDTLLPELRRLREASAIRLVDLLFVTKDEDGRVTQLECRDLSPEESGIMGGFAAALSGFGPAAGEAAEPGQAGWLASLLDEGTWAITDAIPEASSAVVALIEHRWAIPLRDVIVRAGGFALEDTWVHPADLVTAVPFIRSG